MSHPTQVQDITDGAERIGTWFSARELLGRVGETRALEHVGHAPKVLFKGWTGFMQGSSRCRDPYCVELGGFLM